MNNDITKFLNLEDDNLLIKLADVKNGVKYFDVERPLTEHFCPCCNTKMHSMGKRHRTVNHPILQDGYKLILNLHFRRWRCQNPECGYIYTDEFTFVESGKRNTTLTELMIVESLRDPNSTAASVARKYNVSDTYVIETFSRYVDMKRYPLTEIISIDEVYIRLSDNCKYALVIQDFVSGELIDLLTERRDRITEPYFSSIPFEERKNVKYLISDMYMPYINYVQKYFPNAVSVVDSFHIIKWILHEIDRYLASLHRKFKERDTQKSDELQKKTGRTISLPLSDEVYLLQNHRWIMLKNQDSINYSCKAHFDRHFRFYMDTYDYENSFFKIDGSLKEIRELKEKYIRFNNKYAGNPKEAAPALDSLIEEYHRSEYLMFVKFSDLLEKYKEYIINSFVMVKRTGYSDEHLSRLSNGPMESLNRIPKDIRRSTRGFMNKDIARNRIMFAIRKNAPILGVPKDRSDVKNNTGKIRGSYKKNK